MYVATKSEGHCTANDYAVNNGDFYLKEYVKDLLGQILPFKVLRQSTLPLHLNNP